MNSPFGLQLFIRQRSGVLFVVEVLCYEKIEIIQII